MTRLSWSTVLLSICCLHAFANLARAEPACGDWVPYKNEKCYKVLPNVATFEAAKKACETVSNDSHLISIKLAEEQQFLANFLFNESKVVDNVWINARFHSGKLQLDGLDAQFTNWGTGRPKSTADDHCTQLEQDSDGKWIDEPCARTGAVVCQKSQAWSVDKLQQTLLDTIKQLEMTQNELKSTQTHLTETQSQLKTSQTQVTETINRLEKIEKNPISGNVPIGFIYSQLGGQPEPSVLWPSTSWEEVSGSYAGQFFRVVGAGAAQFGEVQQENAPRLVQVQGKYWALGDKEHGGQGDILSLSTNDAWSEWFFTGGNDGKAYEMSLRTSSGEVRPRNQAMRLWKRTG